MTLHIYDSKAKTLLPFEPRRAGHVGMYVCGPTVQSAPHIGHLRSALVYDQMRNWFTVCGYEVTFVRNVTDIDDKILANAKAAQEAGGTEPWWGLAMRVEREFSAAYRAIGVSEPTCEPRATGHISDMDALITRLWELGYAYETPDGSIYFDTSKWERYGELTNQDLAAMAAAEEAAPGKRNPTDFALWKAARDGEPEDAKWQISRGGRGRPGWHIECSAMSTRFLGSAFDIHGGGRDLRFPHHENELAQSAAAGDSFAKYWVHNGLVNVGDQKMSKSLGNSLFASTLLAEASALVVRYFLGGAHYRSTLNYRDKSLLEAQAAIDRIAAALNRAENELGTRVLAPQAPHEKLLELMPAEFVAAMNDDFAVPQALAVVHNVVRNLNTELDKGNHNFAAVAADQLVAMLAVLHLDPRHPHWTGAASADSKAAAALDILVTDLIEKRAAARAAKDWAASDEIRDRLATAGIALKDTAEGAVWSFIK
ncbi:cysteine--tRNA ligase [Canibacter zhoujuaniae]|uniref:cysteine--tRNA ligase n=1 Tax=Canibacter zhoujuaniae TaxID=2708343 RepID=UPI00142208D5|nr:cysteine--tRNA ligase [Canibacter zhoujuaniae]